MEPLKGSLKILITMIWTIIGIGLSKGVPTMDLIGCDYSTKMDWRSLITPYFVDSPEEHVSVTYIPDFLNKQERVTITRCYRKATVCVNPSVGTKYEGEPKLEQTDCNSDFKGEGDLSHRPALKCEWNMFKETVTENWVNIRVDENVLVPCDVNSCIIKDMNCKEGKCGKLWLERPFKKFASERTEVCLGTMDGFFCPESNHILSDSDKIIHANSTNTIDGRLTSTIAMGDKWVKSLQFVVFKEIIDIKTTLFKIIEKSRLGISEDLPGFDEDEGKLKIADCKVIKATPVKQEGLWRYDKWYINPWTRELFTDFREEWRNEMISWNSSLYDGENVVHLNKGRIFEGILSGDPGLSKSISTLSEAVLFMSNNHLNEKVTDQDTKVKEIEIKSENGMNWLNWLHLLWGGLIIIILLLEITVLMKHK